MTRTIELWIEARFPNFNDWIAAAKKGRGKFNAYSRLKDTYDRVVQLQVTAQKPIAFTSAALEFWWVEPHQKRDPDNFIAGGRKPVLDGLVLAGVLPDDGWKHIRAFHGDHWVTGPNPGVRILLEGESNGEPARPRTRKYPRTESRPGRASKGRVRPPVAAPAEIESTEELKLIPGTPHVCFDFRLGKMVYRTSGCVHYCD